MIHPPPAYGGHHMMGQYGYPQMLDISETDSGPVAYLQSNLPVRYHPQAPDVQQSEPCQALAYVNAMLHTIPRSGNAVPLAPQPEYLTPSGTATYSQYSSSQSLVFDQSHLNPYWAWDSASAISGHTSNSSRLEICYSCGEPVNSRQMQRHIQDRHRQEGDQKYVCKCGHEDPALRKWNYTRHLDNCKRMDRPGQVFTCRCGDALSELPAHLDHIKDCGKKRAGRRSKRAPTVN
ncbi:uncharacterized protein GLRG_05983 [Colletotrichum graminicola M1.001]|uniref:Uncharacterized protein n=1 Tax=Colletotrichum graminicola (strain M1.001 / M2 / FGSC 10212) TaxID=645133 RepID=E3QJ01_COLGM|nr:uncharacterized protein GLRG_05983 [Colletotrichum graminicola M1.001]EFQ30839.1 hypothetical protein GLRG_05983 [Colletotrichum graminicola M1.001]